MGGWTDGRTVGGWVGGCINRYFRQARGVRGLVSLAQAVLVLWLHHDYHQTVARVTYYNIQHYSPATAGPGSAQLRSGRSSTLPHPAGYLAGKIGSGVDFDAPSPTCLHVTTYNISHTHTSLLAHSQPIAAARRVSARRTDAPSRRRALASKDPRCGP